MSGDTRYGPPLRRCDWPTCTTGVAIHDAGELVVCDRHLVQYRRETSPTARPLRPCGTATAYKRHLNRREVPCDLCCAAHAAAKRDLRARQRGAA